MALAPGEEGVYVTGMVKQLTLPTDLAACHAIIRDQAERIAKLQAERDAALQLAALRSCLTSGAAAEVLATSGCAPLRLFSISNWLMT